MDTLPIPMTVRYFLPKRTYILISHKPGKGEDIKDVFIGYQCLDCTYSTQFPQNILNHQKNWHGWDKCLIRIKES